jgi:prepilin-type N-terminal cleavage/methylation domain-containing protein/prepilin-type processing-associated H-X9-DG protein
MKSSAFRRVVHGQRRAFTLIELLVVIAIIALLVSILLPSLNQAKELGRAVVCATNQKALGLAFQYYLDDWNGWLPGPTGVSASGSPDWWSHQWPYVMNYYAGGEKIPTSVAMYEGGWYYSDGSPYRWPHPFFGRVSLNQAYGPDRNPSMYCPSLVKKKLTWPLTDPDRPITSWSMAFCADDNYDFWGYRKFSAMTHPGDTVYIVDYSSTFADDPTELNCWTQWDFPRVDPHLDNSNYLFLDWHVERMAASECTEHMFNGVD